MRGPADLLAWRDEFPAVAKTVHLGSHTLAPLSRRVRAAVQRFLDLWEEKASAELVWFEDIVPEMRRVEALYAALIGADPDEVVLTPSVSTGISSVATAIDFEERSEVVVSRQEFPTDRVVWLAQERRGARVQWVDGKETLSYLDVLGADTAVVSASRVSYLDGAVLDADVLARACRDNGTFLLLDDYHGSGVVPIDVHACGCDVMVGGPLKYLLGGPGVAFLYVARSRSPELRPLATGWFSQNDFFAFEGSSIDWPEHAQRFALGTPSPAAVFAAGAGLDIVAEVGLERIRERVSELTGYAIERASDEAYRVLTPADPDRRGGLVAFEVPDAERVLEELLSRRIVIDQRHGALRASPHFFSSEDDVDALFDALRGIRPD